MMKIELTSIENCCNNNVCNYDYNIIPIDITLHSSAAYIVRTKE